jgi:hypothetical protein
MKLVASILVGLLASYLALLWVSTNFHLLSAAACSDAFTGEGLVCRFAGAAVMFLVVPLAGAIAFWATMYFWPKRP